MASINASGLNMLFSNSSTSSTSWLSDYAAIKNGSYKKMLKAYYANQDKENGTSGTDSATSNLTSVQKNELLDAKADSDSLKTAAGKLTTTGSKSLFQLLEKEVTDEKTGVTSTVKDYDRDAITSAVKDFVNSYNSLIESSLTPTNADMTKKAAVMANTTKTNKSMLADVGITVGADYKLTIDEQKFKEADMNRIMTLFNGKGSYASQVSQKADEIGSISSKIITNESTGYGGNGGYRSHVNTGSLFNDFF